MVDAAKNLIPILVDVSERGAHKDMLDRYGVRGIPAIIFVNSSGERLETAEQTDASSLVSQIEKNSGRGGDSPGGFGTIVVIGILVLIVLGVIVQKLAKKPGG